MTRLSFEEHSILSLLQTLETYEAAPPLTEKQSLAWLVLNWNEFCPAEFFCAHSLRGCAAGVVVRSMAIESVMCLPWRMDIREHIPEILHSVLTETYKSSDCFCFSCMCHERVYRYIKNVSEPSRIPEEYRDSEALAASSGFWSIAASLASTPMWNVDPRFGCLCPAHRLRSHGGLTCTAAP
jgi:hypothetical protein